MRALAKMLEYILHIDLYVGDLLRMYGVWFYGLLFLVLFAETGLVVTPFLPGDSLLFAAGALVARGRGLGIGWVFLILCAAAILGDTANYWIGHTIGPRLLKNENSKVLKKEYLDRTHAFFAHYGGKTIVLARFVPFVRTFAPFLAGVGEMHYGQFITYNLIGGVLWVALFLFGGFLFGRIPFVEHNLFLVLAAVVVITTIPIIVEYLRQRRTPSSARDRGCRADGQSCGGAAFWGTERVDGRPQASHPRERGRTAATRARVRAVGWLRAAHAHPRRGVSDGDREHVGVDRPGPRAHRRYSRPPRDRGAPGRPGGLLRRSVGAAPARRGSGPLAVHRAAEVLQARVQGHRGGGRARTC